MGDDGGSGELGDIEKHIQIWEGRFLPTGPVRVSKQVERFEAALRLRQGASKASQPGAAAAAAGPPAADGGGGTGAAGSPAADGGSGTASGGGAPEPRDIELTRKISALEAKIEQLEERNANLEDSLRSPDSKLSSPLAHFKQFASSPPSF